MGNLVFVIEDEIHASPRGSYATFEDVVAELRRLSRIPWDEPPNRAPCTSWRTCGCIYEIIEYDDTQGDWNELRRLRALEVSATGVIWSRQFEELTSERPFVWPPPDL
jgi:hypothetical protein